MAAAGDIGIDIVDARPGLDSLKQAALVELASIEQVAAVAGDFLKVKVSEVVAAEFVRWKCWLEFARANSFGPWTPV